MYVLSCEPATCAVPEWHKELFRDHEEIVTSSEGWSPGSLNLAQAFATKMRTLLAHGDITRLLIDFSKAPDDPGRFSRFSMTLSDDQRRKLDERHHSAFINLLRQRISEERQRTGQTIHLSIRTEDRRGLPTIGLIHDASRGIEADLVRRWCESLVMLQPQLAISISCEPAYPLSVFMRQQFPDGFGSISLVVDQSCFLAGSPIRWEPLKKSLLDSLPRALS